LSFWLGGQIHADLWRYVAAGAPALEAGTLLGDRVATRFDRDRFRTVVLMMLAASGTLEIVSALVS